jgi:hypothetical protein
MFITAQEKRQRRKGSTRRPDTIKMICTHLGKAIFSMVMALTDDLNRLAAQDVVYLTRTLSVPDGSRGGSTEVFRGRLRQALNGDWVFNASTGQNGVVGFMLGGVNNYWSSSESPASGLQVTITNMSFSIMVGTQMIRTLNEMIVLTTVIPTDFTD